MIEIHIAKGTVLGTILAVIGGVMAGYVVGGFTAFLTHNGGPQWLWPITGVVTAFLVAWLGWEVGEWFTRP